MKVVLNQPYLLVEKLRNSFFLFCSKLNAKNITIIVIHEHMYIHVAFRMHSEAHEELS